MAKTQRKLFTAHCSFFVALRCRVIVDVDHITLLRITRHSIRDDMARDGSAVDCKPEQ